MLRHGKPIVLLLVIIIGAMGYFLWNQNQAASHTVWVATQDILPGSRVSENMIEAVKVDKPLVGLTREEIVGKTATVRIPKGTVISTGVETPKDWTGSLVNIPVNIEITGLVNPGDTVELVGIIQNQLTNNRSIKPLGTAKVAAIIDKKGQAHRYGPVNELPAVLVVEVNANRVADILDYVATGKVYPILGGVSFVAPNDGE